MQTDEKHNRAKAWEEKRNDGAKLRRLGTRPEQPKTADKGYTPRSTTDKA